MHVVLDNADELNSIRTTGKVLQRDLLHACWLEYKPIKGGVDVEVGNRTYTVKWNNVTYWRGGSETLFTSKFQPKLAASRQTIADLLFK